MRSAKPEAYFSYVEDLRGFEHRNTSRYLVLVAAEGGMNYLKRVTRRSVTLLRSGKRNAVMREKRGNLSRYKKSLHSENRIVYDNDLSLPQTRSGLQ